MSPKTKIFITGVTGYIGGSVLERLLDHPDAHSFEITALIRSPEKAEKFKEFGVNSVVGSFNDTQLIEDLTAAADVVFDTVDADMLDAAKVLLRGSKRRFQETGKPVVFIHTSGTGLFMDNAAGLRSTDAIWDDTNSDELERLPPNAPHRDVDLEILQADREGYVKGYLVSPSTIYGMASGKFVDAGLQNKHSIQIPALVVASLGRGRAGMVGKGLNVWPNVHIDDIADLYVVLFNAIRANPDTVGHGRDGYYFGVNGEHTMYDVGKEVGRALVALGRASSDEPTTFTQEDLNNYFKGSDYLGTNSRAVANRSRSIGWKPKKTTADFLGTIKDEVEEIIRTNHQPLLR